MISPYRFSLILYFPGTATRSSWEYTSQTGGHDAEMLGGSSWKSAFLLWDNSWTWRIATRSSGRTLLLLLLLLSFILLVWSILNIALRCTFYRELQEHQMATEHFGFIVFQPAHFDHIWGFIIIIFFFYFLFLFIVLHYSYRG